MTFATVASSPKMASKFVEDKFVCLYPLCHPTTSNGKVVKPVSGKTDHLAFEFSKTKLAKKGF